MKQENIVEMINTPFVKIYDLQYEKNAHYYDVTRRSKEDLMAVKPEAEFKEMLPDAVSCVIVLDVPGKEPQLCVMKEFRYPIGRFVLSVPSGLVDQSDISNKDENPVFRAAKREVEEETGISFSDPSDEIQLVNPLLYCSPGLTDESTSVVKIVLHRKEDPKLSQEGAVGSEVFDGIKWITKEEAVQYLKDGTDHNGIFYSAITWISLMTFVSDIW